MFGLFLILPVFALYADGLAGSNAMLVGVALGAYGVTQALLQVPFGMLSDRFGRKPLLTAGLLLFVLGSVVAAKAATMLANSVSPPFSGTSCKWRMLAIAGVGSHETSV